RLEARETQGRAMEIGSVDIARGGEVPIGEVAREPVQRHDHGAARLEELPPLAIEVVEGRPTAGEEDHGPQRQAEEPASPQAGSSRAELTLEVLPPSIRMLTYGAAGAVESWTVATWSDGSRSRLQVP